MMVYFFKQKTAYELRISDWSSDVCSSDLLAMPGLAALAGFEGAKAGALASLTVYAVPQVLAAAAPMGPAAVQMGTLVKLTRVLTLGPVCGVRAVEIGRESCRERVCQYV